MASTALAIAERGSRIRLKGLPALEGMPILYEDDKEADLGEANQHIISDEILHVSLMAHFARRRGYRVFSNMNLYYNERLTPLPYVSPDCMVVKPRRKLGERVQSYRIGRDGPAPVLVAEILSERSWEQYDVDEKVTLYAKLRIPEYILIDVTGEFYSQKLALLRLQADGAYRAEQDADGGLTSRLGFRVVIEEDGQLRVINAKTGKRYARPHEAQALAEARLQAEARVRKLEAEIARLRKAAGRGKP